MLIKASTVLVFSLILGLMGCNSSNDPAPEIQPPVNLPEIGGGETPAIPMPPIEGIPPSWPQELLEIEARYGIPVEDSWALCTTTDVTCYWNFDTSTFQWLCFALDGERDGDSVDVRFYLDENTAVQGFPQMTAKLSNTFLTDPVDHEQYRKALFEWYHCSLNATDCSLPFRVPSFQDSHIDGASYITTDYQIGEDHITVNDMKVTANHINASFRIEQKYQQTGESHSIMRLLFDRDDERRARLFNTTADVLTHVY